MVQPLVWLKRRRRFLYVAQLFHAPRSELILLSNHRVSSVSPQKARLKQMSSKVTAHPLTLSLQVPQFLAQHGNKRVLVIDSCDNAFLAGTSADIVMCASSAQVFRKLTEAVRQKDGAELVVARCVCSGCNARVKAAIHWSVMQVQRLEGV
jgi:hypothetical protein